MKYIFLLLISFSAFASDSTKITCEMKRDEWDKMVFNFRFLTPKRGLSSLHFQKGTESGVRNVPVTAVHQSSEARYVGLNFFEEEKLVFILLSPIFSSENLGVPVDIEVVSSIYGPILVKCRAIK
jgi:hypothetical protein